MCDKCSEKKEIKLTIYKSNNRLIIETFNATTQHIDIDGDTFTIDLNATDVERQDDNLYKVIL